MQLSYSCVLCKGLWRGLEVWLSSAWTLAWDSSKWSASHIGHLTQKEKADCTICAGGRVSQRFIPDSFLKRVFIDQKLFSWKCFVGKSALSECKIHLLGQILAPSTPLLYGQCTPLIIPEFWCGIFGCPWFWKRNSFWRVCLMSEHTRCFTTDIYIDNSFNPWGGLDHSQLSWRWASEVV